MNKKIRQVETCQIFCEGRTKRCFKELLYRLEPVYFLNFDLLDYKNKCFNVVICSKTDLSIDIFSFVPKLSEVSKLMYSTQESTKASIYFNFVTYKKR